MVLGSALVQQSSAGLRNGVSGSTQRVLVDTRLCGGRPVMSYVTLLPHCNGITNDPLALQTPLRHRGGEGFFFIAAVDAGPRSREANVS